MKNLLFGFALCLSLSAFSQPQKGNFLLSGNFSVINNKDKRFSNNDVLYHNTQNSFSIMVEAAYFVSDRISVGLFDRQEFSKRINDNDEVYNDNINSLAIAGRFYIPVKKGGIFFENFAGLNFGKSEGPGGTDKISGCFAGISPAVYYYITGRIALEAEFGSILYDYRKTKAEGSAFYFTASDFSFLFSPWNLSLGMSFTF